jgi:hypothetical protein
VSTTIDRACEPPSDRTLRRTDDDHPFAPTPLSLRPRRPAAEPEERERAVAAGKQLIQALERRLEDSRRRLEERLEQVKDRNAFAPVQSAAVQFRVPTVDESYFDAGSNADEEQWWSRQLGRRKPSLAA